MEFFLFLYVIIGLAIIVLSTILFLKVWRMTNDVRKLRIHFLARDAVEFMRQYPIGTKAHVNSLGIDVLLCGIKEDKIKAKILQAENSDAVIYVYPSDLTPLTS